MQDYSTTCPWAYLAECVEGDMFPQELLDKLKAEKAVFHNNVCIGETTNLLLRNENKKLKEEQLTEENAIRYVYENTYEYDDWVKGSEAYKELKEENKKLQEYANEQREIMAKVIDGMKQENKKLKEEMEVAVQTAYEIVPVDTLREIEKLKEELLYYRFYTYTLDRSGDCDLNKDDVDKFTDDEAQRKDLYERIGYEEDSDDPDEE